MTVRMNDAAFWFIRALTLYGNQKLGDAIQTYVAHVGIPTNADTLSKIKRKYYHSLSKYNRAIRLEKPGILNAATEGDDLSEMVQYVQECLCQAQQPAK